MSQSIGALGDSVTAGFWQDPDILWPARLQQAVGEASYRVVALARAATTCQRGVPLVNFLTAPFYLFDAMDVLDKIHPESLVPVTRAAIRIIESTRGVSAAALRAGGAG